ncbi:MAG TPA: DciA family protein [Patescibacteria group bacterium]|jgi:hypothetical protein|nr:DciA family protein [Patescibacteria group bacterium]
MAIIELKSIIDSLPHFKDNWKFTLLSEWPCIIGHLNTKISLEKITENSVVLGVIDSCWMQELYLLTPLVQSLINKSLDKPRIKKVLFKQKNNVNQQSKYVLAKEQKKKLTNTRHTPISIKESTALANIQDHELRYFLKQFRDRCLAGVEE